MALQIGCVPYQFLFAIKELISAFAKYFYSSVNSRTIPTKEVNTIFEMLIIALHQSSALHALQNIPCKSDVARIAIVGWYYGIYNAASAMIAAQDGSVQTESCRHS